MSRRPAVAASRGAGLAALAALAAFAGGCATARAPAPRPVPTATSTPAPPEPPSPVPAPGTPIGTTASGGTITINHPPAPAVVDSTPSEDALAVLRAIPEPLGGSRAEGSVPDTARVPVPAPTQPLGDRPGARPIEALPESIMASPRPPPGGGAPVGGDTNRAAVPADSCWRVQVKAPAEGERAERLREAASSQLDVPFVVEREGGLFKVRTRDCFTAVAASELRRRAEETGFAGAFRFRAKPR